MKKNIKCSVLIPTHNRGEMLKKTLASLENVKKEQIDVKYVLINNNSNDNTEEIGRSFLNRLPLIYLSEPNPGKNHALNMALNSVDLGDIVIFTDDDVMPDEDWLMHIVDVTKRWPQYSIFGGRVKNVWPPDKPAWVEKLIEEKNYMAMYRDWFLDHGRSEIIFPSGRYPSGANMWVRADIFRSGHKFDAHFGPRPKKRIMGSEISFSKKMDSLGYRSFYSPHPFVYHIVPEEITTYKGSAKRAYRAGRSGPHLYGVSPKNLYEKNLLLWLVYRSVALAGAMLKFLSSFLLLNSSRGIIARLKALRSLAHNREEITLGIKNRSLYKSVERKVS